MGCARCMCNHCANNVECSDCCTGEMDEPCFNCDECFRYDGDGRDMWRATCSQYKVTEQYAKHVRRKIHIVN